MATKGGMHRSSYCISVPQECCRMFDLVSLLPLAMQHFVHVSSIYAKHTIPFNQMETCSTRGVLLFSHKLFIAQVFICITVSKHAL